MEFPVHPRPLAHLPLLALRIPGQVKQCQRVKKLPELGVRRGVSSVSVVSAGTRIQRWTPKGWTGTPKCDLHVQRRGKEAGR